jgi:tetratricopeptide (TPR) repeat protein
MDSIGTLAEVGLDALWFAATLARSCYEARDAGEYSNAVSFAEGARSVIPNHSAATLCEASVYELTDRPIPTLIQTYALALASDRRLDHALQRLVTLYLEYGDTLSATVLMAEQLRRAPSDRTLRARVAYNWVVGGRPDSAFTVLRPGSDDRDKAENLDLLRIISRICLEKEMWRCQFAALERRYELDAALRGDTLFYYQVVGVAQNLGDEDGVLRWTTEGISAVGQRLDLEGKTSRREQSPLRALWMAQAGALTAAGDRDSAVAVYLHVARGDPTDVRPILAAAETLVNIDSLDADSATWLDTTAFERADSLLTELAEKIPEDSVFETIAATYFSPAATLVRHRMAPELASDWLEKAITYDVAGALRETANGLNGLALSYVVERLDGLIREQESCDLVDQIDETIKHARRATLAGRNAMPDVAAQVLPLLEEYATFVPQYREVLRCND